MRGMQIEEVEEEETQERLAMEEICTTDGTHIEEETPPNPPAKTTSVDQLQELLAKLKIHEAHPSNIAEAVLSALGDAERMDPHTIGLDDEPRTWKEAQESPEAEEWRKGYLDELKSLKEMGVYKLVPRSSVPVGAKI